jgi:integrase/recombinase XerD
VTVSEAVATYVQKKQASGRDYRKVAQVLNSFAAALGNLELSDLKACHVALFLNKRRNLAATWYHKYMRIKGLFRYWAARGELKRLPLPRKRASRPTQFYPYIFSRPQIRQLLRKVPAAVRSPSCVIQSQTMKNLLLFLYGTGLHVGDALRIRLEDLDMQNSTVKILGTSARADRVVPLGGDIKILLIRHLRVSANSRKAGRALFATKLDRQLNHRTLSITFRRLCKIAKISRQNDSVYQPRLHDLRHTFAVHRIIFWHRRRASIQKMLPLLAAYMGMITVTAMEKYLLLAPSKYISQMRQVG